MYKIIESLKPYFFSLREINNTLNLDIKIPESWKYEEVFNTHTSVPLQKKVQDRNNTNILLSIISSSDEEGCNESIKCALGIIKLNREEEEKTKLFNDKVDELKKMFINKSLDELKNLNFTEDHETDGDRERIRIDDKGEDEVRKRTHKPQK